MQAKSGQVGRRIMRCTRALIVAAVASGGFALAACGAQNIQTTTSSQASSTAGSTQAAALTVGDSSTLIGNTPGEKLSLTLLAYMPSVQAGQYDTPDSGTQYVGAQLSIANIGTVAYNDSPSNGLVVVTTNGQQSQSTILTGGPCSNSFASSVNIAPGYSEQGCVPVEIPVGTTAAYVQYTPDSGFASNTAQWTIPGSTAAATTTTAGTSSAATSSAAATTAPATTTPATTTPGSSGTTSPQVSGSWHGTVTQYAPDGTHQQIAVQSHIGGVAGDLSGDHSELTIAGTGSGQRCAGTLAEVSATSTTVVFLYTETLDLAYCIRHTTISLAPDGSGGLSYEESYQTSVGPGELLGHLLSG
jgi:hypothetical protein